MSSTPQPENQLEGIAAAAEDAGEKAKKATTQERLGRLESRLASVEPLLEQLQAQAELGLKIRDYVDDLRAEQTFFNVARWVVGIACILIVVFLLWLLRDAVYNRQSPLLSAPPVAIATFVIGIISGIVLLMSGFTKGVYRSAAERHSEGFLPPALNAALEAYQKIIGKRG